MTATLHELPATTLSDISRVLRAIADEIDDNVYGPVTAAVVVLQADQIETFGAGAADHYHALGLLFKGQLAIAEKG
jgi:hypothetical protein